MSETVEMMAAIRSMRQRGGQPVIVCHPSQREHLARSLEQHATEGETVTVYTRSEVLAERDGLPVVYVVDLAAYFDQLYQSGEFTEGAT